MEFRFGTNCILGLTSKGQTGPINLTPLYAFAWTELTKFPTSYWAMGHLSSSLLQDLRQRGPRLHHHRDAQRTHRRAARTPYRLDSRLYFLFMLLDPFDSIFCLFALYLSLCIYVYIYLFIIIYINILFISLTSLCGRRRA